MFLYSRLYENKLNAVFVYEIRRIRCNNRPQIFFSHQTVLQIKLYFHWLMNLFLFWGSHSGLTVKPVFFSYRNDFFGYARICYWRNTKAYFLLLYRFFYKFLIKTEPKTFTITNMKIFTNKKTAKCTLRSIICADYLRSYTAKSQHRIFFKYSTILLKNHANQTSTVNKMYTWYNNFW